ncbi:MAG TPA: EAL domain-containing protein [Gammaproteobacteria bacterium]|nr:EAL domain-containing protein [Gammaproteobacteria bacterium]
MNKDPIKLTIGLGFAGVLALMGLISFISLSQMNAITNEMTALLTETNAKISAANTMRDSIRQRGDTLYQMYLTDDFIERDELHLKMAEYALEYKLARDELYSYPLSAREARLLNDIIKQTRAAKAANDRAADDLLSDLPDETVRASLDKANIERQKMLTDLTELVSLQETSTRDTIEEARKYQETISNIVLLLSLAAFFIALYIAQLVIRETSRKNSEIHFQATHDELTRLVNRKEFNQRLQDAHKSARDNNETHALCFLDLDNFKTVNDNGGHKAGDELLIELTHLIRKNIRSNDTLARIGGDEFGLLLEGCSLEKAIEISEGLVSLIKNYEFNWHGKIFHVGVSIGLVVIDRNTDTVEKALQEADIACYAAKDMGRNQVQIHELNDERVRKMQKELSWVADINNRNNAERFSLFLQAIKNLQTDEAPMYEVLLRLNDDEGKLVSPGNYIPAAERFSLMKDVDRFVIEQSFEHLSELYQDIEDCNVRLFINISSNSLNDPEFADYIIEQYKKYNIYNNAICLEISETKAVKNLSQTSALINRLHRHRISFALDDFGSGIPSFSYLKELSVDYLKIHGDIITSISNNSADRAMVAAIQKVGAVMNIKTVAKHVEDVFTLNQLRETGIDYAQGFYLDRPRAMEKRIEKIQQEARQAAGKQ